MEVETEIAVMITIVCLQCVVLLLVMEEWGRGWGWGVWRRHTLLKRQNDLVYRRGCNAFTIQQQLSDCCHAGPLNNFSIFSATAGLFRLSHLQVFKNNFERLFLSPNS